LSLAAEWPWDGHGLSLMRQMLELSALAKADAKTLVTVLAPLFDQLLARGPRRKS